jgi:hypothetical protein
MIGTTILFVALMIRITKRTRVRKSSLIAALQTGYKISSQPCHYFLFINFPSIMYAEFYQHGSLPPVRKLSYSLLLKIPFPAKKFRRKKIFFCASLMKCSRGVSLHFLHFCLSTPVHNYGFIFSVHSDIFVACLHPFFTPKPIKKQHYGK